MNRHLMRVIAVLIAPAPALAQSHEGVRTPPRSFALLALCSSLLAAAPAAGAQTAQSPSAGVQTGGTPEYVVLVASEAVDEVAVVRFRPGEDARVERTIPVGILPADPDGPHGLSVASDGRSFYVTTAHGVPFGYLWKYDAGSGRALGKVELGNFPATLHLTPDGRFAFVVNFNLHGYMVPSSVSVVATGPLLEVARIPTCTMPHGSRLNPQGTLHYSACMMDDLVVEIDVRTLSVSRHFLVTPGRERGMAGAPDMAPHGDHGDAADHAAGHGEADVKQGAGQGGGQGAGHAFPREAAGAAPCSPTWAQPSADGRRVFVACNKSNEIVELDVETWAVTRRLAAGEGVYNLAVTRDGRLLLATNKRGRSVSVFEIASGREPARVPTSRSVVHGVVVSPDDRYAFISVEGIGSEPGTLEVLDLAARRMVARVDVGQMAGGIDLLPIEGGAGER